MSHDKVRGYAGCAEMVPVRCGVGEKTEVAIPESYLSLSSDINKAKLSKLIGQKMQMFDKLLSLCKNTFAAFSQPVANNAL